LKKDSRVPEGCSVPINIHHDDAFASASRLKGDSDALDMVLEELLGNACRYAEGGGPVRISVEDAESYWLLRITNPGRIPKGEDEEIFKLDRRGSNARGEGLGLGLAIARTTARFHSGNLVLENSGSETGRVVFRLEWPYARSSSMTMNLPSYPPFRFWKVRGRQYASWTPWPRDWPCWRKVVSEKAFDLVFLDLRFPNGIPAPLRKYLDQPDEENAFQRYGLALGKWLEQNRPALPFIYYTILPARSDDPKITVDKLKDGPLKLLDKIQRRLQARRGEDNVAIGTD